MRTICWFENVGIEFQREATHPFAEIEKEFFGVSSDSYSIFPRGSFTNSIGVANVYCVEFPEGKFLYRERVLAIQEEAIGHRDVRRDTEG